MASSVAGDGVEQKHGKVVGFGGRLWGLFTCRPCRKRCKRNAETTGYSRLRALSKELSEKEKAEFKLMAWWSEARTQTGSRIFVLAPRGPGGDTECSIDMWKLCAYAIDQIHDSVMNRNEIVTLIWVQLSNHRIWPYSAAAIQKRLPSKYATNLEAIHVVHPSWTVRFLRLFLWPIASEEFWDRFHAHERIEFLDSFVDLNKLNLPADLYDYDRWLDAQADEMSKTAAKQMNQGGFGGTFGSSTDSDALTKEHKEQMEELKKLLEEQGRNKKSD